MGLSSLPQLPEHPISQIYAALAADPSPDKMDLGIGVYRDAQGKAPVMACVQEAERRLLARETTKEYLTPLGNPRYCRQIEQLIFGTEHPARSDGRLRTAQTPGAGGALRVASELIKAMPATPTVWVPKPTWEQQRAIIQAAGLRIAEYPYYDRALNRLSFDDMLTALGGATPGDVVLLHGCCHNPSGEDLTQEQWRTLGDRLAKLHLLPFIDLAYQGFGDGIEADTYGIRLLAGIVPEMIVVSSSSKSFGVYRDRAGAISLLLATPEGNSFNTRRHLLQVAGSLYFMPPNGGAEIVAEILEDPELSALWRRELDDMRKRIQALRRVLSEALMARLASTGFGFLQRQRGMFSLLPLVPHAVRELARRHSIYMMPDARINLAALSEEKALKLAACIAELPAHGL